MLMVSLTGMRYIVVSLESFGKRRHVEDTMYIIVGGFSFLFFFFLVWCGLISSMG